MAVNLATKYSSQIAEVFTAGSFVKGKTSTTFDLTGVKTLKVYTPVTVPEVDYTREGMTRYGTVTEMQDIVQELKMTQDKAFTLTIDKGNYLDQNMSKKAADMLRLQINEQSTPAADKYALKQFAKMAGTIATTDNAPTKDTIVELISTGAQTLDDNLVPDGDRYIYVTAEVYKMIRLSPEFTGLEGLGVKAIGKGICGEISGLNIVRVPKSWKGAASLSTISGAVNVRGLTGTDLSVETVSGDLRTMGMSGMNLNLKTATGDIHAMNITCDGLNLRSVSGQVKVQNVSARQVKTFNVSGETTLEFVDPFEKIEGNTVSGNIRLYAPITEADATLSSLNGRVRTSGVFLKENAPAIRINSISGDLEIHENSKVEEE